MESLYEELSNIRDKMGEKVMETASQEKPKIPIGNVIRDWKAKLGVHAADDLPEPFICKKKDKKADNLIVFDKLVSETPFVYKCGEECRRSLSNYAANLQGSIDYFMWLVICAIPLCRKTPPEFQSIINLYLRLIYESISSNNITQLFKLDVSMARMITLQGTTFPFKFSPNYLELGPNPIVFMTRKMSICGDKVNTKAPSVEPATESLYHHISMGTSPSFQNSLAADGDISYRQVEHCQRMEDAIHIFDENIANCLFQALFTADGKVEAENLELLEASVEEAIKLRGKEVVKDEIEHYLSILSDTWYWVQYIRCYIQEGGETPQTLLWAKKVYDTVTDDSPSDTQAYEVEVFCLFDLIHTIFRPTSLAHTLRAD